MIEKLINIQGVKPLATDGFVFTYSTENLLKIRIKRITLNLFGSQIKV